MPWHFPSKPAAVTYSRAANTVDPPSLPHNFTPEPAPAGRGFCFLPRAGGYDLNPPSTLLAVPPALRARPHTGALNFSLLPYPEGAVCSLEPLSRGAAAGWGLPLWAGGCAAEALPAADAARRSRGSGGDRVRWTKQGAAAGAALQFSQGRSAARRENWLSARGTRSAFCKRATSRAAKTGHRNPDWVKIIPRIERQSLRHRIRREAEQLYRSLRNPQNVSRLRTAGAGLGSEQRFKGR